MWSKTLEYSVLKFGPLPVKMREGVAEMSGWILGVRLRIRLLVYFWMGVSRPSGRWDIESECQKDSYHTPRPQSHTNCPLINRHSKRAHLLKVTQLETSSTTNNLSARPDKLRLSAQRTWMCRWCGGVVFCSWLQDDGICLLGVANDHVDRETIMRW